MGLDDIDLYQVRMSLVDMGKKAFQRFEGMSSAELAVYSLIGRSSPPYDSPKDNLNSLLYLINSYVATRSSEFQREFFECPNGNDKPNEMKRETTVEEFLSSASFDVHLNYSDMLGIHDRLGIHGLSEIVEMEKRRVASEMMWNDQRSEGNGFGRGVWIKGRTIK